MSAVDEVVDLLKDGEWHSLKDLAENLKLNQEELQKIIQFLKNLDLIKLDPKQQRALIDTDLKQLIALEKPEQTSQSPCNSSKPSPSLRETTNNNNKQ